VKRVNYLNNKDMLTEIHKSKNSFCSFVDPLYASYDIILTRLDKINVRTIAEAKRNRAKQLSMQSYEDAKISGKRIKISDCEIDYKTLNTTD
jgi:GTP-binding protein EngB required for normal cell division